MDIALTSFGKKIKRGVFSNEKTKGIFWYEIKKIFKIIRTTQVKNEKFKFSKPILWSFSTHNINLPSEGFGPNVCWQIQTVKKEYSMIEQKTAQRTKK